MKRFGDGGHNSGLTRLSGLALASAMAVSFLMVLAVGAQSAPARKLVKPGHLVIDGFRVKCGRTPALISETYPDFGAARRGLIILNPRKLRNLPRGARLLIYYHECAHQYVGGSELAADCWAVQKVRREGLMDRAGLKNACTFIAGLPANRRHPPGKMRCQHMKRCYNETFRARADKDRSLRRKNPGLLSSRGFSAGAHKSSRDVPPMPSGTYFLGSAHGTTPGTTPGSPRKNSR